MISWHMSLKYLERGVPLLETVSSPVFFLLHFISYNHYYLPRPNLEPDLGISSVVQVIQLGKVKALNCSVCQFL